MLNYWALTADVSRTKRRNPSGGRQGIFGKDLDGCKREEEWHRLGGKRGTFMDVINICLLYTSDAADDRYVV